MFKITRQAKIKEILLDRGQIDVQTLSSLLNVSSVTIRNDLELLESQGFLIRTHGGAILNDTYNQEKTLVPATPAPTVQYDKYRDSIGQIAANLITDNEWIFLGPGRTCCYIAKALSQKSGLNIITNNLNAVSELSANKTINLVLTGGSVDFDGMFLSGEIFNSSVCNIHVSKAFFSVAGIDLNNGVSVRTFAEQSIYSKLKTNAGQIILVADYTKFDVTSLTKVDDLDRHLTIVSNENIPAQYKEYFFNQGIKLFTSYDIKASSLQKLS